MTNPTKQLFYAAFILMQFEINLSILERNEDLLVKEIIGEKAWALLDEDEVLSVGREFSYMVKNKLIPFTSVGKTSSNSALYRLD